MKQSDNLPVMSDEEITKALKICATELSCDDCPYASTCCAEESCSGLLLLAYRLIERLQDEIKEYETLFDIFNKRKYRKMFNEEWKKEYQKELDKQGEGVIAGFPDGDYVYKRYFEQKAEIERLTEELKVAERNLTAESRNYESSNHIVGLLKGENAELQKQVDELKQLNERIPIDKNGNFILYAVESTDRVLTKVEYRDYVYQQAEQDAVKEITTELLETKIKIGNEYYIFADNIKVIAKHKGVEVE